MPEEFAAPDAAPITEAAPAEPVIDAGEAAADAVPASDAASTATSADASAQGAAAADQPAEITDVKDYIRQGLASIEQGSSPAEEKKPDAAKTDDEPAAGDTPPETEKPKDEKAKSDDEDEAADEDDDQKPKEKTDEAKSDDADGLKVPKVAFKTRAEIEKDFDRIPKAARSLLTEYAEAGTAMQATLETLGGEAFVAPLSKVVEGLQSEDGNNMPVFSGLLEAGGIDRFADIVDDVMGLTMVEVLNNTPKNAGEKRLHDKLKQTSKRVIEAVFGDDATIEHIGKLVQYDKSGHLNTKDVDQYFEENPHEKEMPKDSKDRRIADLEAQLADKAKSDDSETETAANDKSTAADFDKEMRSNTHPTLEATFFKTSILKPVQGDDETIRDGKKAARALVRTAFDSALRTDPRYTKLKESAAKGETTTANYKRRYAGLVESAISAASDAAAPLEALVALVYGGKRNVDILERSKSAAAAGDGSKAADIGEPTQTIKGEELKDAMKDPIKWRAHLRQQLNES